MKKLKTILIEFFEIIGVFVFQINLRKVLKKTFNSSSEFIYIWISPRLHENIGDLGMSTVLEEFYKDKRVVFISNNSSVLNFETKQNRVYFNYRKEKKNLFDYLDQHHPKRLIIVGADTLDGSYGSVESLFKISTAWIFQRSSVHTHLINMSWNERKLNFLLKIVLELTNSAGTEFISRDVMSFMRLQAMGIRPILSADLVFSLKPKINNKLQQNFENWNSQNPAIVAIGFGAPRNEESDYLEKMVDVCRNLLDRSYSILLSPSETGNSDIELNRKLISILDSDRIFLYQGFSSNYEFAELISRAQFGITNRMHFAIHALLMLVPVVGVEYNGKFEGLYKLLDMEEFNLNSISEINAALQSFIINLQLCRKKVRNTLPQLVELSENNLR
jgi:polysaccharide pyruvyl transferase WcaK-like protein